MQLGTLGLKPVWLHRISATFNGVATSGTLKLPMAVKLEQCGPEKARSILLSLDCHAQLGMMKCVRDGSISLDGYGGQSLEVARQIGADLFMIGIDHLTLHDYPTNLLFTVLILHGGDDFVHFRIDVNVSSSHDSAARDCEQLVAFNDAMVSVSSSGVSMCDLRADTIVVRCGAVDELSRRSIVSHFVSDKNIRKHFGLHARVLRCVMDSDGHHENHHDLCTWLDRFFTGRNLLISICKSGRHRSVANAELWSNTLACLGREVELWRCLFWVHRRRMFDKCKRVNTLPWFEDVASSPTPETSLRETKTLVKVAEQPATFRDTAQELTQFFRTIGTATDVGQSTSFSMIG